MCICLEDSIADGSLVAAEEQLVKTLTDISRVIHTDGNFFSESDLPLIFIRIRNEEHFKHVHNMLTDKVTDYADMVCG